MTPALSTYLVGAGATALLGASFAYLHMRHEAAAVGGRLGLPDPAVVLFWLLGTALWPMALFLGAFGVIAEANHRYGAPGEDEDEDTPAEA